MRVEAGLCLDDDRPANHAGDGDRGRLDGVERREIRGKRGLVEVSNLAGEVEGSLQDRLCAQAWR